MPHDDVDLSTKLTSHIWKWQRLRCGKVRVVWKCGRPKDEGAIIDVCLKIKMCKCLFWNTMSCILRFSFRYAKKTCMINEVVVYDVYNCTIWFCSNIKLIFVTSNSTSVESFLILDYLYLQAHWPEFFMKTLNQTIQWKLF